MKSVHETVTKEKHPVKILQYGEGNFLRAFVEYMIDIANKKSIFNGNVQIVKAIPYGSLDMFDIQNCVYTVLLRGKVNGATHTEKSIVSCVDGVSDAHGKYEDYARFAQSQDLRFIISNTTEAGIVYDDSDKFELNPPKTYPGKLTKFLYERYTAFNGAPDKGLIILPAELIEKNGDKLKDCCLKFSKLWNLTEDFQKWLCNANVFCNTLVDRIVTGYPKDEIERLERELGYTDKLLVTGEPFALWVIETDRPEIVEKEFPLDKAGLPVIFTKDLRPYRERKVRILNGAHTSSALAAYMAGIDTVGEMMKDKTLRAFLERAVYGELTPFVPLPEKEARDFADSVMERFENPFIQHNLLSIALNSISKFKARVLPTIKETSQRKNVLPHTLCFSLSALIYFYSTGKFDESGKFIGKRDGKSYEILDDAAVLQFFSEGFSVEKFLSRVDFWGEDLTSIPSLAQEVDTHLNAIKKFGMRGAIEDFLK